jgi:hypothetical protein
LLTTSSNDKQTTSVTARDNLWRLQKLSTQPITRATARSSAANRIRARAIVGLEFKR